MRIPQTFARSQVRAVDNRSSIVDNCTKFSYVTAQLQSQGRLSRMTTTVDTVKLR